jgi:hypothetical protein
LECPFRIADGAVRAVYGDASFDGGSLFIGELKEHDYHHSYTEDEEGRIA